MLSLKKWISLTASNRGTICSGVIILYNRPIFNVLQSVQRQSRENVDSATARVAWDTVNQDCYFGVFEGMGLQDGVGHGQQAWAALREKFNGCSREALLAEHHKMNQTHVTLVTQTGEK